MSDPSTEAREFVQRFVEGLPTDVQKLRESAGVILAALQQAERAPDAVVWLLRERTGRPIAAYTERETAIECRVELARRNPSTFDISVTEVVPVVVDPTVDELFDPAAMRKLRAT